MYYVQISNKLGNKHTGRLGFTLSTFKVDNIDRWVIEYELCDLHDNILKMLGVYVDNNTDLVTSY